MSTNQHSGDSIPIDDIIAALTALAQKFETAAIAADAADPAGARWTLLMGKESGVWAAIAAIRDLELKSARGRWRLA